ncbi:mitochondrial carrier domain-containing protein [Coniella lustricola]|uniref:Mitochondrial carrier domain-containing protein n=1 Tax=Coniella lustricola TaxID=2025994 RepID=A0A2T3ABQ7_9PEZI|nr:mitochondrial carrier domain-containing protein [Coniella lustricola]
MQSKSEATGSSTSGPARKDGAQRVAPSMRYPFWFGGSASSMAACVTHPLDLVKVRMQMRTGNMPSGMLGTFQYIVRNNGVSGLYAGLSASLLRQITYSTTRFGIYEELKSRLTKKNGGAQPSFPVLVGLSCFSGFIGGISGNAADITNVRMQHDAALPVEKRRNYKHALDGMLRMAREEGLMSWFRGMLPNSLRAAAMTASQLASYDTFKKMLIGYTPMSDNLATHFTASFMAGVAAATVTSPIDVVKTRVMSASGKSISIPALLKDLLAKEGPAWMFKGWVPSFLRLGPQTICTFVFLEMHRNAYRKFQHVNAA